MDSAKWLGIAMVSLTLVYILRLDKFIKLHVQVRRPHPEGYLSAGNMCSYHIFILFNEKH